MKRLIIIALIVAAAIFFYQVADLESMSSAILSMSAEAVFVLILMLIANEIVKGLRWAFFLRSSGLEISTFDALTSYLAAQAGTALPGGSLIGARLAQEHGNVKMRQATASLVGQTFGDAFALSLMASVAIVATQQRGIQLFIPLVTVALALFGTQVIRSLNLWRQLMGFAARYRLTARFLPRGEDFREYTVVLMRARVLVLGSIYSVGATILSTAILLVLGVSLTERGLHPFEALYAHSFSTVARVLVPVPGGYGVSDGSLAGLLNYLGIGLARATFVALAYRTVIMVFRTIFGALVLVARYPHLLVGQLRVPEQRPAAVPISIRGSPVGTPQPAASTGHNAETTDYQNSPGGAEGSRTGTSRDGEESRSSRGREDASGFQSGDASGDSWIAAGTGGSRSAEGADEDGEPSGTCDERRTPRDAETGQEESGDDDREG